MLGNRKIVQTCFKNGCACSWLYRVGERSVFGVGIPVMSLDHSGVYELFRVQRAISLEESKRYREGFAVTEIHSFWF